MSFRNMDDFLATAVASIASGVTATNGTEFTSKEMGADPNQVAATLIFTTAGGDGGEILAQFQASFDGGSTWTTGAFAEVSVPSDHPNASNVVRYSKILDVAGISHLRLWKVTNGDGTTAITSVQVTLSWGHMY